MAKAKAKTARGASGSAASVPEVTRFAHQFFTPVPADQRARLTDEIKKNLGEIPKPKGKSVMTLADVVGKAGADEIAKAGTLKFQAFGDSGHVDGRAQELVADAASTEYDIAKPAQSPAFLLQLGDVIYYDNTDRGYHAQFYAPYKKYPGKIVAIPGNHDGELFKFDGRPTGQSKTLEAFLANFCRAPKDAAVTSVTILRNMVSQPGVYWRLDAPFVDIVGLYSNIAENPGYLRGPDIGDAQKVWLDKTLAAIKTERDKGTRKALVLAVHHPPISNGSHGSSVEMLADMDDACNKAGLVPDMVLAAHSHDYQRYTRSVTLAGKSYQVPYLVVGTGGRGLSSRLEAAKGQKKGDHVFEKSLLGYGYLNVAVTSGKIAAEFIQVDEHSGKRSRFDTFEVDLAAHAVVDKNK